eukprot:SAG11_NODE_18385_length_492_cov_1.442748_2_plen_59_part_01
MRTLRRYGCSLGSCVNTIGGAAVVRWEEELYNVATLKLGKLVILVCIVGHWLGCAFYFF